MGISFQFPMDLLHIIIPASELIFAGTEAITVYWSIIIGKQIEVLYIYTYIYSYKAEQMKRI